MDESRDVPPAEVENTQGRWYRRPSRRRRSDAYADQQARPVDAYADQQARPAPAASGRPGRSVGGEVAFTLARLVQLATGIVVAIIVAGILLVWLNANPGNDVVSTVHDAAKALVGPFDGMFTLDSFDATIGVNWGIAAIVYLILGALIARAIVVIGTAGVRRRGATRV
jgi:hypothetical protein